MTFANQGWARASLTTLFSYTRLPFTLTIFNLYPYAVKTAPAGISPCST